MIVAVLLGSTMAFTAIDPRLVDRLDRATAASVGSLIDSAGAAGIPTEPLVQRALQGATKKAPGARILAAVREYSLELRYSRDAIGARSMASEIIAGASAIHAGASPESLRGLRPLRTGDLTVPLAVLTDLVANGVPVANALSVVQTALQKRGSDQDLTSLRNNVAADIKAGVSPAAAAAVRARGLAARSKGTPPAAAPGKTNRPTDPPGKSRGRNR